MLTSRYVARSLTGSTVASLTPLERRAIANGSTLDSFRWAIANHWTPRTGAADPESAPIDPNGPYLDADDLALLGELTTKLRAVVPGFMGIVEILPASSLVIYEATPTCDASLYRRIYNGTPGQLVLGAPVAVSASTAYAPTGAPPPPSIATARAAVVIPPSPDLRERVRAAHRPAASVGVVRHMTRRRGRR